MVKYSIDICVSCPWSPWWKQCVISTSFPCRSQADSSQIQPFYMYFVGFSCGGFQQPLYEGILRLDYFQPSTLAWLLGISWWRIPPLRGLLRELLPPCIFDVAGGRVWCLKRQGEAVVQIWGEGGGEPLLKFFNFWQNQFRGIFPTWWWSMSLFWKS